MHESILIFDIETVPDIEACYPLTGNSFSNAADARKCMEDYHLDITDGRNSFLRQPFHKIVAISFMLCEIQRQDGLERYVLKELRSGGTLLSTEKELVEGFFHFLERNNSRLISFNGRTFDIPVLKYRAMCHKIQSRYFYLSGDKWNNYCNRYSQDWHCDLLDALSDYGASARIKINEVCSILGFPGKFGVDGSMVADLYDKGEIQKIRDYCETDVLNTYLVYLRYMHHRGIISLADHDSSTKDVVRYLKEEGVRRKHLKDFLDAWEY